ncbi:MAG: DUF6502 family protein, partial [Gammaproteobacteria bacterium]|nr:DUF6502 family protein [Gammaproteobacteria bacterium]
IEKLGILGMDVAGLISTIDHNTYGNETSSPLFQRKIYYDNLPKEALEEIKTYLAENGQEFLEQVDKFMAQRDRDVNPDVEGEGKHAAGIGLYYFEENESDKG